MPVQPNSTSPLNTKPNTPPNGDSQKAEKYVAWLCDLINKDKLLVNHSDLKKFELTCMEDHYRVDLTNYEVEISHSKHPETSADMFVMLFNSLQPDTNPVSSRSILAFVYLTKEQFLKFKVVADDQIERIRKAAEEKRFKEAMEPINNILEQISLKEAGLSDTDKAALENNRPDFFKQPIKQEVTTNQEAPLPPLVQQPASGEAAPPQPANNTGQASTSQSETATSNTSVSNQLREAALSAGLPFDNTTTGKTDLEAPVNSTLPITASPAAQAMGISEPTSAVFTDEAPRPQTTVVPSSGQNIYLTGDGANQPITTSGAKYEVTTSAPVTAPTFNPAVVLNPDNITPLNPSAVQNN